MCDPQIKESMPRLNGPIRFVGKFLKLGFERKLILLNNWWMESADAMIEAIDRHMA